jgi:ABC-2 type transport system permease protein
MRGGSPVTQAAINNPPRLRDVVHSEYLKVTGLRSVRYTTAATIVLAIALSFLVSKVDATSVERSNTSFDAVSSSLVGIIPAQLAIAVLGAWAVTSEYATRTIQSSLLAQPVRIRLFGAKLLVLTATAVAFSLTVVVASFALSQIVLAPSGLSVSITRSGVVWAVVGAMAYLTGWGLLGFGIGALMRRTASAVTTIVILLFVAPAIISLVNFHASQYTPSPLGFEMFSLVHSANSPSLPVACSLFSAYVMAALALGVARFVHGDV